MDTRLTLFIVLIFLVLAWNTVLLWFIYRAVARSADKVSKYRHQCSAVIEGLRIVLEKAAFASDRATDWSGQIRQRMVDLDGNVQRAENWLQYGLAKINFNVDRVTQELDSRTRRAKTAVSEPLLRVEMVVQDVRAILELLGRGRGETGPKSAG